MYQALPAALQLSLRAAPGGRVGPFTQQDPEHVAPDVEAANAVAAAAVRALVEGIDFRDEDFGLQILQRDLRATRRVALWWD